MTRKKVNKQQLMARRRARGLALQKVGKRTKEIAETLKVTPRSVRRWQEEARHSGHKRTVRPVGRPMKLAKEKIKQLEKALDKGAYAFGYAEDYWTLDRIGQVIWQLFEVRYHPSAVWHVLGRMGWSCQRPQRRALQRDDEAVEKWKEQEFPRIKKVSATGRYTGT